MSYTFRWEHPANEVFVTGNFDNWGKTVRLEKSGDVFSKTISLPRNEKVLYKFVADGEWKHDHTAKSESDQFGNVNNVLDEHDIKAPSAAAEPISSVQAPQQSSTTSMAGQEPIERQMSPLPGAFPETPAPNDERTFSINPIPASSGAGNPIQLAPGEKVPDASTFNKNDITSAVHDDPQLKSFADDTEQAFRVNPIPATGGAGNPVQLQPGEKVPDSNTLTSNTVGSNVKLDKESYERSDTGAPVLPPALTPQSEKEALGASIFGLGPQTGTSMIPESSLPMGKQATFDEPTGPTTSSVAPTSTTAQLAGQQPIQPRGVPSVVGESQREARFDPEASANPEAVTEKKEMESELMNVVPKQPAGPETGAVAGAAGTEMEDISAGAAPAEMREEKHDLQEELKQRVPKAPTAAESGMLGGTAAGAEPEDISAAAAPTDVREEKQDLQEELKEMVPKAPATSESGMLGGTTAAAQAPEEVRDEKHDVQSELKEMVPEAPATTTSGTFGSSERGITGAAAGGIAAAGAAVTGAAFAMREKSKQTTGTDPVSMLPQSMQNQIEGNKVSEAPATTSGTFGSSEKQAPEEVREEKHDVQSELREKVPVAPATTESGMFGASESKMPGTSQGGMFDSSEQRGITGAAAGGIAAAGTAVTGAAFAMREQSKQTTGKDPVSYLPQSVQDQINSMNSKAAPAAGPGDASQNAMEAADARARDFSQDPTLPQQHALGEAVTVEPEQSLGDRNVPEEVKHSQQEAHVDPEASANPEAVMEKTEVENQLLSQVKHHDEAGEPAPVASAALSETAPTATGETSATGAPQLDEPVGAAPIGMDKSATSGLNATADSPALPPAIETPAGDAPAYTATSEAPSSSGLNASAATPALPSTSEPSRLAPEPDHSRDVSPMTRTEDQTAPVVTSGVASTTVPSVSEPAAVPRERPANSTPQKRQSFADKFRGTPESVKSDASGDGESKSKRRSLFGRIKEKLKH